MNLQIANISKDVITSPRQDYHINNWQRCLFINTGEVTVEILGVELEKKDSLQLGGNGYLLNEKVSINFSSNPRNLSQKVICIYEVIPEPFNQNC